MFARLDGLRFEYDEIPGDRDAAPLFFMHEGLGSVGLWRDFHRVVARATGRRTLAYSRLGHGASDPPAAARTIWFMHEEGRDVLPRLLERLEVPEPVIVGHSDGASIGLIHAAAGEPVRGLVAMAPHVFVEEVTLASIRDAREAFATGGLRQRMERHHREPDAAFFGWNAVWLHPDFPTWSLEELLPSARCPVLVIQGEDDQYGSIAQVEMIERGVGGPVERVMLPGCQHAPYADQPEATLRAIVRFVERLG